MIQLFDFQIYSCLMYGMNFSMTWLTTLQKVESTMAMVGPHEFNYWQLYSPPNGPSRHNFCNPIRISHFTATGKAEEKDRPSDINNRNETYEAAGCSKTKHEESQNMTVIEIPFGARTKASNKDRSSWFTKWTECKSQNKAKQVENYDKAWQSGPAKRHGKLKTSAVQRWRLPSSCFDNLDIPECITNG
jgi:hypothetical protein